MVDRIGRKMVQLVAFVGSAIFLAALFICTRSITATTMILYGSRLFISIADMCGYVYTPEVYPTSMRGIGLGACSGAGRIGCMITPFVAMVLMPQSMLLSLSLYSGISVLGIITVYLLPIETKGRALRDYWTWICWTNHFKWVLSSSSHQRYMLDCFLAITMALHKQYDQAQSLCRQYCAKNTQRRTGGASGVRSLWGPF